MTATATAPIPTATTVTSTATGAAKGIALAAESDVRHLDIPVWADACTGCGSTDNHGHAWCADCSWDELL